MTTLDAHLDELGNARIDSRKRVALDDLLVQVKRHERGLDVVTGEAEAGLGEVVGAEGEEVSVLADLVGSDGSARKLDHGADGDLELDARLLLDLLEGLLDAGADELDLGLESDERDHDLWLGVEALLLELGSGTSDGADLHDVELGVDDAQAAAAKAEHGVGLLEGVELSEQCALLGAVLAGALLLGDLDLEVARVVEELVQRGIEQAHDDGLAVHGLEHAKEVALLGLAQLLEGLLLDVVGLSEDEVLDELLALAQEHVLGTVEANALGAVVGGELRVGGVVGVGANANHAAACGVLADVVGPVEDGLEVAAELRTNQGHLAQDDVTRGAVDGDDVALVEDNVGAGNLALLVGSIDVERLDAADAGGAHATGDDGRVGRLSAVGREDALGRNHALEVIRRGLPTHEDGGLAGLLEGLGVSR